MGSVFRLSFACRRVDYVVLVCGHSWLMFYVLDFVIVLV